jgi:carboxylesterase type B
MSLIVPTEYGQVQGHEKITSLGRKYLSFQGIPYMKPPLASLRFRDPQPPEPWNYPLNCTKEPQSYCVYYAALAIKTGKEDAGVINVYSPKSTSNQLLPVFVYIHGGEYT